MSGLRCATIGVLGLGVMWWNVGECSGSQDGIEVAESALVLLVEANKTDYVQFEPVYLTCTLKNTKPRPVDAAINTLALNGDRLMLLISGGDDKQDRYYSGIVVERRGKPSKRFAPVGEPGSTMVQTIAVFYNDITRRLAFPDVGSSGVEAKLYLGSMPEERYVRGAPVKLEVREPSGADKDMIESLGGNERLVQLLRRGASRFCEAKVKDECYEGLRALIGRYSDSSYAPPMAFDVARTIGAGVGQGSGRPIVEVNLLREFLGRWPQHPLVPDVMKFLALALERGGMKVEAAEVVRRFENEYPERESPRKWVDAAKLES
jgi:hypothetical protein